MLFQMKAHYVSDKTERGFCNGATTKRFLTLFIANFLGSG